MYAIIASGGKQYRVGIGDIIQIEKLEEQEGQVVTFDKVLLVKGEDSSDIGEPYLEGSTVKGEIIEQGRDKKIDVIKFLRRKRHTRKHGHRQYFTKVKITDIK